MKRLNWFPTRRQFVNHRNIKVAINRHGQRSRYRRSRHDQDMRRPHIFVPKFCALLHTKAVLLINDGQSQIMKNHLRLDKGMSSNQNMHIAVCHIGQNTLTRSAFHITSQERHAHWHILQKPLERFQMLLRQNLCRRHQAHLKSVVNRNERSQKGNHGLSRTHIALKKTIHLPTDAQIAAYLFNDTLLRPRQRKRKILLIKRMKHFAHMREHETSIIQFAVFGIAQHIKLQIKEFVELQAPTCRWQFF